MRSVGSMLNEWRLIAVGYSEPAIPESARHGNRLNGSYLIGRPERDRRKTTQPSRLAPLP